MQSFKTTYLLSAALLCAVLLFPGCDLSSPAPEYPEGTPFLRFQDVEVSLKPITIEDEEVSFIASLMVGLQHGEWDESVTHWYLTLNEEEMIRDTLENHQRCVDGCYNKLYQISGDSLAQLFGTGEIESSIYVTLEAPEDSTIAIDTTFSFTLYEEEPD